MRDGSSKKMYGLASAQLAVGQIRLPVRGIDQQAARAAVQRQRHRVDREIAPHQVFMDPGGRNLRLAARLRIFLGARIGNRSAHAARKFQFDPAFQAVFRHDAAAQGVGKRLTRLDRIALNGKIQIENHARRAECPAWRRPSARRSSRLQWPLAASRSPPGFARHPDDSRARTCNRSLVQALGWWRSSVSRRRERTTCV